MHTFDFIIIGAGIVGMTVARELKQRLPLATIVILEKEDHVGVHASGRNSGVLHSGIYYANDTLKAKVCARGAQRMFEFAKEHNLPCLKSGKVILATSEKQLTTVDRLMHNAQQNGIKAERISRQQLLELEPAAAEGPAAIYCPDTAVIDSVAVLNKLRALLEQQGVSFVFGCQVTSAKGTQLITTKGRFSYGYLYNCAGAHADTIARWFNLAQNYALVPFKGIYWKLSPEANHLIKSNLYPVPDISLPFLGVHVTRLITGDAYIGPTAIPVLGRENYKRWHGVRVAEALSISLRLASMYRNNQNNFRLLAKTELAKYNKKFFLAAAQKLIPVLQEKDIIPSSKAGIRPQLINIKTKQLEMDYIFEQTQQSMHVLNAISPAFTSSFAFAEMIVNQSDVS
ncbi:L-2-hydroxyglutarate oxidase [Legionella maceachernii]|uniref:L-2-hydroxyglutarate oxidase LhgO n=1 Tax=Legionella maceachernii TaxID=466 RepID=A0A0W0VV04_9GAMM|nr:L-2-hydroxyglutarate oxidase [Legionella maceachernii]KTD24148.1 L-2-hydroxyglutarate oxidase LhgO [Legionella maceachernii]SJZ87374.1 L-2-hydroxyglutarate oxidase LhgO [Legionella maceachernii]SUO98942.1 L-2-hydroxyglutarate oxidase LhgO [Legionella maceachernii]